MSTPLKSGTLFFGQELLGHLPSLPAPVLMGHHRYQLPVPHPLALRTFFAKSSSLNPLSSLSSPAHMGWKCEVGTFRCGPVEMCQMTLEDGAGDTEVRLGEELSSCL